MRMFVRREIWLLSTFLSELRAEFDIWSGRKKKFESVRKLIGYLHNVKKV